MEVLHNEEVANNQLDMNHRRQSVGFLTRVTGKKAKVRVNFSKKFA